MLRSYLASLYDQLDAFCAVAILGVMLTYGAMVFVCGYLAWRLRGEER